MAYIEISSAEIVTGKPVSNNTQTKIKDNFIAHETRITSLEGGSAVVYPPIIMRVGGIVSDLSVSDRTGILKTTMNFNLSLTGVRLLVDRAGVSGTMEIDLLYSRAGGAYTSVLSTKPTVVYSAGNDAISSDAVLNPSQVDLQAGDILRLDITSVQSMNKNIMVRIDFTKT